MIFAGALNPPDLPRWFLPGVLDPGSFLFRSYPAQRERAMLEIAKRCGD